MRIVNFGLIQALPYIREKVPEALQIQQLVSVYDAILEPIYTKYLTFSMYLSPISVVGGTCVPRLSTLIF